MTSSYVTVTDQFCGAGGSSLGVVSAGAEVRLAMNHWPRAIETHNTNFPRTDHVCTDISACDPRRYPATDILITSPECTNHTIAKGVRRRNLGQLDLDGKTGIDPAEERSRATMWDVVRFAETHAYRVIIVENVVDARLWVLWDAWLVAMHALEYDHECVYANSMFAHPTPQSRDRIYVVFWKRKNRKPRLALEPLAFCSACGHDVAAVQAWKNPDKRYGKYGARNQYVYRCSSCLTIVAPYYYAAANAIDWSLPGERIGDRVHPLQPKTLARIQFGLDRYARQPFTFDTCYGTESGRVYPITAPMRTQTTQQNGALLVPAGGTWNETAVHTDAPFPTQTTRDQYGVVQAPEASSALLGCLRAHSVPAPVQQPCPTVIGGGNQHYLLLPYYGSTTRLRELSEPVGTVSTHDREALLGTAPAIEDCTFRMLAPHEIQAAMAFPSDYVVTGTSREKVKQLGNAVTPPMMTMLVQRCIDTLAG